MITIRVRQILGGGILVMSLALVARGRDSSEPDLRTLESPEARAAAQVVCAYYRARDQFDFDKARSLEAADGVMINEKGERHTRSAERLREFMDYEKVMHGSWACRALGYANGQLEAEITEDNDYYTLLGIGKSVEIERFRVAGGQIHEIASVKRRYTGRDQSPAYQEFVKWVSQQPTEKQNGVLRNGDLFFDGEGARKQLPLLLEFQALKAGSAPTH